jgi:GNAT superfamily N-acetyltransferase
MRKMTPGMSQSIRSEQLDLTDLLEISDILLRNQKFCFRVASWSMSPTLRRGDQVIVEPVSPTEFLEGDLILYHQNGRLICHRLVAMERTGPELRLITKGDSATVCDAPLQPESVLGRVVWVRPSWHCAGSLSKRVDCWLARLRDEVAQGLLALQRLRSYRRMMRALLSRCVAYYVGIPEGRRWFRYHRIGGRRPTEALEGHQRLHLVAKLARICVGSMRVTASGEGYWIDHLYVRIRYRGLGVASQFISFASTLAAQSEVGRLLAEIEKPNRTAIRLFESAGFRLYPSAQSASRLILVRDCAQAVQRVAP